MTATLPQNRRPRRACNVAQLCMLPLYLSAIVPSAASAQPELDADTGLGAGDPALEDARVHFKIGVDFYKDRNYRAALIEFRTAYEKRPNYKLLYNLGQACVELGEYANAIDYFTRYLRDGRSELSASRQRQTDKLIRSLSARMASLSITSNVPDADIYVDDNKMGRSPLSEPLALSAGRHRITARKSGRVHVETIVDLSAGEHRNLRVDFAPLPLPEPLVAQQRANDARWRFTPPVIWTAVASGAVLAGSVVMSLVTLSAEHEYDATRRTLTTRETLDDLRDDATTKARITDVLWGTTIATAAITTVLFVTSQSDHPDQSPPTVALHLHRSGSSLSVRAAF